eukprot:8107015-Lingulodinium_polyedra.AAC.1
MATSGGGAGRLWSRSAAWHGSGWATIWNSGPRAPEPRRGGGRSTGFGSKPSECSWTRGAPVSGG